MTDLRETRRHATPATRAPRESAALDPRDLAHVVVEGLFGLVFPDPNARLRLGLKAVSRASHDGVAWYVWTTQRPGAFEATVLAVGDERSPDAAVLALRYFPDPGESLFARFAPVEQHARLSGIFDRTGTPGMHRAAELDPSLFHVGTLAIEPQGECHVGLRLGTQDRWLEQVRVHGEWQARRDVPGLELSLALLDPLACGLSYLGRTPPDCVRVWRRPGLAWCIETDGEASAGGDEDVSEWEIEHHGLVMPGRAGSAARAPGVRPAAEPPMFELAAEAPPRHAPWPVNPQWWRAAGWQFEPVGMFCGRCATEEAEGHSHPRQPFVRSTDDELTP